YKRDRTNAKRKVGSSISPWDNVVATLPDMSTMISKTYVNEIDVSKVAVGQKVNILVDAFPEKSYTGSVISVANIGEQLPNADAKVFEVVIKLEDSDPILRPSMTTGNQIVTMTIDNVTFIPIESVQLGADSIPFVYTKKGIKQIIVTGEANENHVIVEQGLEPGTQIYLSTPEKPEKFKMAGEDLIAVNQERARIKREEEKRAQDESARARERNNAPGMGPGMMMQGGGGGQRDTAALRRMMESNPEMRQRFEQMRNDPAMRERMQNTRRDTSARTPTTGQQGQVPGQVSQRANQN
ncbi:MAG: HlyD family efflux transporter periplasmic adaptor subunit, partial [Bacteroidales bacterium]|nr:HlyD family efflux transporter periplasmic adaptor subunit [Bacteroidales bacterium]